jgi:hypothetical protein
LSAHTDTCNSITPAATSLIQLCPEPSRCAPTAPILKAKMVFRCCTEANSLQGVDRYARIGPLALVLTTTNQNPDH